MGRLIVAAVATAVLAGCGSGDDGGSSGGPEPTPNAAPPASGAQAQRGRRLVTETGCLACHRIGEAGNDGVGPELSSVGARMPRSAIARSLVAPSKPMPSYEDLPAEDREAIVTYLAGLRGPDRAIGVQGRNERR